MSLTASRPLRISVAALSLLLASQFAATAAPPNPDRAAHLQKEADDIVKQAENYEARAANAKGDLADALTNAATVARRVAEGLRTLATTDSVGNDEDIKSANAALIPLRNQQRVANEQVNLRQQVVNLQPTDAAIESLTTSTPEANKPLIDALLAAKKNAIDASDTFYAVLTPETNPVDVEVARDVFQRSLNEVELANVALQAANDRARRAASKGADQVAAAAKLAEITMTDEERLAVRKALQSANLQLRSLERKRAAAVKEFEAIRNPPQP